MTQNAVDESGARYGTTSDIFWHLRSFRREAE